MSSQQTPTITKKPTINLQGQNFYLVCGLEIHAELKTKSKMFCGCKNDPFNAPEPNTYTCPVCLGMPGGLPVANRQAIESLVKLGLALDCQINQFSKFDRKNYFYPDLAKGYQISQFDLPFVYNGLIETDQGPIRITRIHLEEDTAKLLHEELESQKVSLIDFNRSGVPLAEIVSEPDIQTASQAATYARNLRELMRYLGVADCDMEKGGMRLEANISLQTQAQYEAQELPAYKVEVKNINSFNFMEQAVAYEIERQAQLLVKNQLPVQETRGYNPQTGKTFSQRAKEDAADYRYFPDPDLPPIVLNDELLAQWRSELPETKADLLKRWQQEYGIEERFGYEFTENRNQVESFENLLKLGQKEKIKLNQLANFIVNKKITWLPEQPQTTLQEFKKLTTTATVDEKQLKELVESILAENQDAVSKYQAGQKQVLGFFMGQIMKTATSQFPGVKLDPGQVTQTLNKLLA